MGTVQINKGKGQKQGQEPENRELTATLLKRVQAYEPLAAVSLLSTSWFNNDGLTLLSPNHAFFSVESNPRMVLSLWPSLHTDRTSNSAKVYLDGFYLISWQRDLQEKPTLKQWENIWNGDPHKLYYLLKREEKLGLSGILLEFQARDWGSPKRPANYEFNTRHLLEPQSIMKCSLDSPVLLKSAGRHYSPPADLSHNGTYVTEKYILEKNAWISVDNFPASTEKSGQRYAEFVREHPTASVLNSSLYGKELSGVEFFTVQHGCLLGHEVSNQEDLKTFSRTIESMYKRYLRKWKELQKDIKQTAQKYANSDISLDDLNI